MNVQRPRYLGGFLPTRVRRFGDAASVAAAVPWDELIQAGTVVATTAIEKGGKKRKRKKAPAKQPTAPVPVVEPLPTPKPAVPWGPILLVASVVAATVIASGGRNERRQK